MKAGYDAIVVGAGPNGLAAAIEIALAGRSVLVVEAKATVGGGTRTAELTLPGFRHDICSAIHPMAIASPFLSRLPLAEYGLEWIESPAAFAHPLDDGSAAIIHRSVTATAETLGADAHAYRTLMEPLVRDADRLTSTFLGPMRIALVMNSFRLAQFGLQAIQPAASFARGRFKTERGRALFGGLAAHSSLPLTRAISASFGLMLGMAGHAYGWPMPRGGSQAIGDAMAAYLRELGGEIVVDHPVRSLAALPPSDAILFDLTPRQILSIAGDALPEGYRRQLRRYRYGPGVFKLDLALAGPIPWRAAGVAEAGTVHLGGTLEEIVASEAAIAKGQLPDRPFTLLAQPSLFDRSRAPGEGHTAWAYCHVPNGSDADMTEPIFRQIERFAPGVRNLVLASHSYNAVELETYNSNYVGGDIHGGVEDLRQLFTRPAIRANPYSTPNRRLFICSSSTPPGSGVHGMCGYWAARAVLRSVLR